MSKPVFDYTDDDINAYKRGLDYQREAFKAAKHENDYDSMCDAIENIKSEIKEKCKKKGHEKSIARVEKITKWYRTKEARYIKKTPDGSVLQYPAYLNVQVNNVLTRAYEILIQMLELLELL